jgi:septal ring factor EnvC (AmiA/AmiB activator)
MKKFLIVFLLILSAASCGFLVYDYMEYGKYDKRVEEKKKDLSKMKEELANEEKTKEDRKKELEEIKTKNKTKIEELEKWQKKTKKVEESL